MTSDDHPVAGTEPSPTAANRIGLYSAILTAVMTVVTFGLAIIVIPDSGAGGREDCVEYPYLDTLSEFPRDYLWMPPGDDARRGLRGPRGIHPRPHVPQKKVYGQIGLSFALIAAGVLLSDYFV